MSNKGTLKLSVLAVALVAAVVIGSVSAVSSSGGATPNSPAGRKALEAFFRHLKTDVLYCASATAGAQVEFDGIIKETDPSASQFLGAATAGTVARTTCNVSGSGNISNSVSAVPPPGYPSLSGFDSGELSVWAMEDASTLSALTDLMNTDERNQQAEASFISESQTTDSYARLIGQQLNVAARRARIGHFDGLGLPLWNVTFTLTYNPPPYISSTSPLYGAIAIPANTKISFTFSEVVVANNSSFSLDCQPTGATTTLPMPFAVSMNPGGESITLSPRVPLPMGGLCTATAIASRIKSRSGAVMPFDDKLRFIVGT